MIIFSISSAGIGNRLFVCEVTARQASSNNKSPDRVLLRLYGGNVLPQDAPIRTLSPSLEVMLFYALCEKGIGPKMYGCFDGGRIEEFIDGRNLTISEWTSDKDFNVKIAIQVARYHLVDFPIPKREWDIRSILMSCYESFLKNKQHIMEQFLTPDQLTACKLFLEYDVEADVKIIVEMLPKVNSRIVFTHNDINRSNVMMRNSDTDVRLIDYEFSSYNYRAFDLGNHFALKIFDLGAAKLETGAPFPSEEYMKEFIASYSDAIKSSGDAPDDWDEKGRDSVDHILMEAVFGSWVTRLIDIAWMSRDFEFWFPFEVERESRHPDFDLKHLFDLMPLFCQQQKQHFIQLFEQLP